MSCTSVYGWSEANGFGQHTGSRSGTGSWVWQDHAYVPMGQGGFIDTWDVYGCYGNSGTKTATRCCTLPYGTDDNEGVPASYFGSGHPRDDGYSKVDARYHETMRTSIYSSSERCGEVAATDEYGGDDDLVL